MQEKMIVLSMDAMVREDVAYLESRPHFARLMAGRAEVERVEGIYPSITYPAHVTIATGCFPGKHGVISNTAFKTVKDGIDHWHLYAERLRVEDLFRAARRAGRSTAAVYWPVTGLNAGIDDLIDEYFFPYYGETPEEAFAKLGAHEAALEAVRENLCRFPYHFQKGLPLTKENTFDDFVNGCACSLIRRRRPDLLMLHNCYLDSLRHRFGVFAPQIREGLDLMDLWLGELTEAMEDAGVYDRTNFVILSDHGQMNFVRRVKLNCLLARGGFIDQDGAGQVTDWRAFAQSNGMSATIYIKEGAGKALEREVGDFLRGLAREGVWGFQEVLTRREARRCYGMYGPFAFMVETDGYTAFSDSWEEPLLADADPADYRLGQATHGYQPEKGPQPVFLARGPAFQAGAVLPRARLVDEAPTLAKVLGADMPEADGVCLDSLLASRP